MNGAFSYSRAQIRAPNYGIWCCCLSPPGGSNQVREDNCRIVLTEEECAGQSPTSNMLPSQQKCQTDSAALGRTSTHRETFSGFPPLGSAPNVKPVFLCGERLRHCVYTMKCQIQSSSVRCPLVLLQLWDSGSFAGLGSLQCNCVDSLLYPEAWHHAPLLTSIIWL